MDRQMRTFITVVETNSFFEAGEALHISQSAVSQQIKALENELQAELIARHGRSFSLTPAGKYFFEQARRQVATLDAIVRETRSIAGGETQRLRVGVLHGFSRRIVEQAIRTFVAEHPRVNLTLTAGTHEELFQKVSAGTLDMVVNDQWRALSDLFANEMLLEQPLFAMVRHGEPLAAGGTLAAEEAGDALCILVTPPEQRESEAVHWRDVMGLKSSFLFAESLEIARMNAAAGAGFLPCDEDMMPGGGAYLVPLTMGGAQMTRKVGAFWPLKFDGPLQPLFVDALRKAIQ